MLAVRLRGNGVHGFASAALRLRYRASRVKRHDSGPGGGSGAGGGAGGGGGAGADSGRLRDSLNAWINRSVALSCGSVMLCVRSSRVATCRVSGGQSCARKKNALVLGLRRVPTCVLFLRAQNGPSLNTRTHTRTHAHTHTHR